MAQKKNFIEKLPLDKIISWGASVVIIGAMAKLAHWSWGGPVITIGLAVEAFLFFLMGFVGQSKEPSWEKVYPQLSPDYKGDLPNMDKPVRLNELEIKGGTGTGNFLPDLKIGDDFSAKVKEGLDNFSSKISAISNAADASIATNEFATNIKSASVKANSLGNAFDQAAGGVSEIVQANAASKEYHVQINNLGKNISALNAVYELELQDSSAHLKSMNTFYQNISQTMQNFNESLDDSKQFKDEVGKLSKNLASLNSVYGNMLSAMNQPRA